MTPSSATLHVTKLTAAKRQLQAAIRLFFMEEDELAIHTVGSASYGLLKDIKRGRGRSEAADSYRAAIFYAVRDFHRGTLPDHMTSDPATMLDIEKIAAQLTPITADSKLDDLRVTIPSSLEKHYWNTSNQAANFLKHADRDNDKTLLLDKVDNNLLILKCYSAYRDIAPDDLGYEGLVFEAFMAANNSARKPRYTAFDNIIASIRELPNERRLGFCYKLIIELNKN